MITGEICNELPVKTHTKTKQIINVMSYTDPNKKHRWPQVLTYGTVPASYKTPIVLLTYAVKYDKTLFGNREKKKDNSLMK